MANFFERRRGMRRQEPPSREEVAVWLAANVKQYGTPTTVTLHDFEVDWERISGSFRVSLDDLAIEERFSFFPEASGWATIQVPLFHSPLGVPASYAAVGFTSSTDQAILKGLRQVIPRLRPCGLDRNTGIETTMSTPLSERIAADELTSLRARVEQPKFSFVMPVATTESPRT